ncbi:CKLF-like MARVEL transmembrane domain-containing protein 4 [Neocloeon triangulifer]|uniref:CKLF-like MARVEL transmembrane domain-containing protein 4 n=1 Tax=Neocloeon triangulifer TaxID=2078957 RepID=UPI00286F8935|nr:CKLF-like MARVEL transmembrane domain-containing protein 4 [Neocloeon triangulifer]XP_059468330.1 CKLF-like MARVEL transmembrane domain-containing protein 4 [Neocloeon triangulifer]
MMAETTVPPPQTVPQQQATVKTDPGQNPGGSLQWLEFNVAYFLGLPGMLKLVQVLIGIICMACASPARMDGTHWFLFVAVTAFIATLIWVFLYLLSIREALKLPINWTLTEFVNYAIFTLLYVIAFIVQLSVWSPSYEYGRGPNIAAGVFGLFNSLAYAASTYFLYVDWKAGIAPPQQ